MRKVRSVVSQDAMESFNEDWMVNDLHDESEILSSSLLSATTNAPENQKSPSKTMSDDSISIHSDSIMMNSSGVSSTTNSKLNLFDNNNNNMYLFNQQQEQKIRKFRQQRILKKKELSLDMDIQYLKKEIEELKTIVEGMMDESYSYAIKYTRRLLISSNIVTSIYLFLQKLYFLASSNYSTLLNPFMFISIFRNNKNNKNKSIVKNLNNNLNKLSKQNLLTNQFINSWKGKYLFSSVKNLIDKNSQPMKLNNYFTKKLFSMKNNNKTINPIKNQSKRQLLYKILKSIWKEIFCVFLLITSSYWVMKPENLKKKTAIFLSFIVNLYLILFKYNVISPYLIIFNFFSIFMYMTAIYVKNTPESVERVKLLLLSNNYFTKQNEDLIINDILKDKCKVIQPIIEKDNNSPTIVHRQDDNMMD
ncbi:hypothetical protein ABK040_010117 [Willaertia magna]